MSRSNYDKPFYVDVGTSLVAVRCASNHDVLMRYDYSLRPHSLDFAKGICDRMNKEVEFGRLPRNCDVGTPEEQDKRREPMVSNNETIAEIRAKCLAGKMTAKNSRRWATQRSTAWRFRPNPKNRRRIARRVATLTICRSKRAGSPRSVKTPWTCRKDFMRKFLYAVADWFQKLFVALLGGGGR